MATDENVFRFKVGKETFDQILGLIHNYWGAAIVFPYPASNARHSIYKTIMIRGR